MVNGKKGFTLFELVIVMSLSTLIIAVITSLIFSMYNSMKVENNEYLRQLELANCKDYVTNYMYDIEFNLEVSGSEIIVTDGKLSLGSSSVYVEYVETISIVSEDNIYEFTINCNDGYSYIFLLFDREG